MTNMSQNEEKESYATEIEIIQVIFDKAYPEAFWNEVLASLPDEDILIDYATKYLAMMPIAECDEREPPDRDWRDWEWDWSF